MSVQASTTKTNADALASEIIQELTRYFDNRQNLGWGLATVSAVVAAGGGNPATLTVSMRGSTIPNVRYMGATPAIGDTVIVLSNGTQNVSLGKLT